MKVLYFHQHFSTRGGATGTRSYELARQLIDRGHKVTMVCGSSTLSQTGLTMPAEHGIRRGQVDGIDVIEICLPYSNYDGLLKRSLIFLAFAWKSIWIAWRQQYDLLFATSTPLTAAIPGIAMRLLKPGRKFVFEVRDLWPELPKAMGVVTNPVVLTGMSVLEKAAYSTMHGGVALSPGIELGIRRRAGASKRIEMIPNGCDNDLFGPLTRGAHSALDLPSAVPREGLRCVFAGAHGHANGLDGVLDAARVLLSRGRRDVHLIFVGDGKLKPQLMHRCREEQLSNCYFLDPMPKLALTRLLHHVDVGLMILANVPAFYYGTSPNKFFDYIAAGLPVLNNYPGWLAELIRKHNCGVVVPPDNAEALADALGWMADHEDRLHEMGWHARQLASRSFDRKDLANRLVSFLETVASPALQPHVAHAATEPVACADWHVATENEAERVEA